MAGDKPLNLPDDLERLLRRTLSVEPSPAFLPRVRQRIAEGPPPSRWLSGWVLTAAGAVALGVVAVALLPGTPASPPRAPLAPSLPMAQPISASLPAPIEPAVAANRPRRALPDRRISDVVKTAEVLVDQRQRAALSTLVQMVQSGRITEQAFAKTTPPSLDAIRGQIVPVDVAPVSVSPLAVDGVLQKGTERK